MRVNRVLLLLMVFVSSAQAGATDSQFDDLFTVVFIDEATEAEYGAVPLSRSVLADAIYKLADAGAKGVVLKFFLDQAKDDKADDQLAAAMQRLPVILQARIDNSEVSPNALPERFILSIDAETSIDGRSGWIPAPRFSDRAQDIGFADYEGFPIPLLVSYQDRIAKSLFIPAIELATGNTSKISPGVDVKIGDITLAVDRLNRSTVRMRPLPDFKYIPFQDVLHNRSRLRQVKDKIVILGYDGPHIHNIETEAGSLSAHKMFVQVLKILLRDGTGH